MPRTRPPYSPEFRRHMVELVRAGRDPADLAREFELSAQAIRNWVMQTDLAEARLRREVRQLRLERLDPLCGSSLSKAAAWFARETGTLPSGSSGS